MILFKLNILALLMTLYLTFKTSSGYQVRKIKIRRRLEKGTIEDGLKKKKNPKKRI